MYFLIMFFLLLNNHVYSSQHDIQDEFKPGIVEIPGSANLVAIKGTWKSMFPVKIDAETGKVSQEFNNNDENIGRIEGIMGVSLDGKLLAFPMTGNKPRIKIFDLNINKCIQNILLPPHILKIHFATFDNQNNNLLISYPNKASFSSQEKVIIQPGMFLYDIREWQKHDKSLPEYQSLNANRTFGEGYDIHNERKKIVQRIGTDEVVSDMLFDNYYYRVYLNPENPQKYIAHMEKTPFIDYNKNNGDLKKMIIGFQHIQTTINTNHPISCVAFHPTEDYCALNFDTDNRITIYDIERKKNIKALNTKWPSVCIRNSLVWNKNIIVGYQAKGKDSRITIYKNPIN